MILVELCGGHWAEPESVVIGIPELRLRDKGAWLRKVVDALVWHAQRVESYPGSWHVRLVAREVPSWEMGADKAIDEYMPLEKIGDERIARKIAAAIAAEK